VTAAGGLTAGRLLGRVLRVAGVDAVYGRPLTGVDVTPVNGADLAALMAEAHGRVHGRPAAVHLGDGRVAVGARGDADRHVTAETMDELLAAVDPVQAAARTGATLTLAVTLDPAAPAPDTVPPSPSPIDRWIEPDDDLVATLAAARRPVVLAGPGVVRAGAVPGLHALAASASLGVLNTWGAKGVFDWRSRHHLATAGMQARDFELAGFGDADLIVATGVDPAEAGGDRWRLAPVAEVPPGALDPLSARWSRPGADIALPPLRDGLARVTQEGWASTTTPLAPSLATRHYSQVLGTGGLVAADPGTPGFWVARTFATTELGAAQVPAAPASEGFAVACALVARLRTPLRPVLAAVTWPLGGVVQEALDTAARLGVAVPVEAWGPDAEAIGPDDHLDRLRRVVHADAPGVVGLPTDRRQLDRMIEVAGEIVAWTG
jgi:Thiamine pyrophosphate enzyme, central domain